MSSLDPLKDADFKGYVIPSSAMFVSMLLQYMQPWTDFLTVISRITLYFIAPSIWVLSFPKSPTKRLIYLILMLPWMIKCTTVDATLIENYCVLSSMLSILPVYELLMRCFFSGVSFRNRQEKLCICLFVFLSIPLAAVYCMKDHQIHAIQQSFPFIGVSEAFGLSFFKATLVDSELLWIQKIIYILFNTLLFPLTAHLYWFLVLILLRLIFIKE